MSAEEEKKAVAVAKSDDDSDTEKKDEVPVEHSEAETKEIERININDEVIELFSIRLFSIEELPLKDMTNCTELTLRKNVIHGLVPFPENLRKQLVTLDLFDNKIARIQPFFSKPEHPHFQAKAEAFAALNPPVTSCEWFRLTTLDLSYNQVKKIDGLDDLGGTLENLYLTENKIKKIEGLEKLVNLKQLELGGNQIREIGDGLRNLVKLEQLWLGKNKIGQLDEHCFTSLVKLKRLSLQANRIISVPEGVFPKGANPELEELYLSENGIPTIEGIENLASLTLLDVSFNPIKSFYCAAPAADEAATAEAKDDEASSSAVAAKKRIQLTPENLPNLEEFWMTDGKLDDWKEVELLAPFSKTLRTIYLERNPIENDRRYRSRIFLALPFVTQIDSWPVVNKSNPDDDRAARGLSAVRTQ